MEKPGDFFVGVTDLFSVLLPGAVVSFVAMKAEQSLHPPADLFGLLQLRDASGYTAFVVCSFLLGHLADMIGASFLDRVYDLSYADYMRYRGGLRSWLSGTLRRLASVAYDWIALHFLDRPSPQRGERTGKTEDPIFVAAKAMAAPKPEGDKLYQWCRDWLQVSDPQALQEPDRLQANSKFFRAIVVAAISFAVMFWLVRDFRESYSRSAIQDFVWTGGCVGVIAIAFLRYSDLRWKAVQHVYRLYVIRRECERQGAGESERTQDMGEE